MAACLLVPASGQDMPLTQVLIDGEDWQVVAEGYRFTDGFTSDDQGNLYFSDVLGGTTINRIAPDGQVVEVVGDAPRISGIKMGPDQRLYACQGGEYRRIVAFDLENGQMEVIANDVQPNDLVVTHRGDIYFTETRKRQISFIAAGTKKVIAVDQATDDTGPLRPNGIAITPDRGTLAVSDHGGRYTWVWRIEPDGKLSYRQPYMTLKTPSPADDSHAENSKGDGMTTDAAGRYYITSAVGLQMFDPTGRMGGVIASPSSAPIVSVALAGPQHEYLYVAAGDKVFRRKTKTNGFVAYKSP